MKKVALFCLLLACCSHDSKTIAQVNDESISFGDYKSRLRAIQFDSKMVAPEDVLALKKNILNEMIEEQIIQQESKKLAVDVSTEEVQNSIKQTFSQVEIDKVQQNLKNLKISQQDWNQQMKQKLLAEKLFDQVTKPAAPSTDDQLHSFYEKNLETFHVREQAHIRQIVVQDKEQAKAIQQEILQGEDFSKVALKHPSVLDGRINGDVGFVSRGVLPEVVDHKIFSMKPGTVSPILDASPDYYLVELIEKTPDHQLSFEEARQQIQSMLLQEAKNKLYTEWLQQKTIQAKIKRNDELLQENFSL